MSVSAIVKTECARDVNDNHVQTESVKSDDVTGKKYFSVSDILFYFIYQDVNSLYCQFKNCDFYIFKNLLFQQMFCHKLL
jgi:hypothetical protein